MHTAYKELGFDIQNYPNAYNHFAHEITLPLHTCLTDEQVQYVIDNFVAILREYLSWLICKWEKLPPEMQTEEVKKYYDILRKKIFRYSGSVSLIFLFRF